MTFFMGGGDLGLRPRRQVKSEPHRPVAGSASDAAKEIEERLAKLSPVDEVIHQRFCFVLSFLGRWCVLGLVTFPV